MKEFSCFIYVIMIAFIYLRVSKILANKMSSFNRIYSPDSIYAKPQFVSGTKPVSL